MVSHKRGILWVVKTGYKTPKPQYPSPSAALPTRIKVKGATVLAGKNPQTRAGQPITTKVRCTPRMYEGQPTCKVQTSQSGKVTLRTSGHTDIKVTVTQTAPATSFFQAFKKRKVYRLKG